MSVMAPEVELIDLTHLEDDMALPCDFSHERQCKSEPAEWILHAHCPGCGSGGVRLACDRCKRDRLDGPDAVTCSYCMEVISPARHAYVGCERLNRSSHGD